MHVSGNRDLQFRFRLFIHVFLYPERRSSLWWRLLYTSPNKLICAIAVSTLFIRTSVKIEMCNFGFSFLIVAQTEEWRYMLHRHAFTTVHLTPFKNTFIEIELTEWFTYRFVSLNLVVKYRWFLILYDNVFLIQPFYG